MWNYRGTMRTDESQSMAGKPYHHCHHYSGVPQASSFVSGRVVLMCALPRTTVCS